MKVVSIIAVAFLLSTVVTFVVRSKDKYRIDFEEIIEKVNSKQKNWVAGHNKYFEGMDYQTIKGLMGALQTPEHLKLPQKDIQPLKTIPQEFFSAQQWPHCESIRQIRDQSNCGSCWAFGAVEVITDRICIFSNQTLQTRISAADMLSCCSFCGYGCGGGYSDSAMNHWWRQGVVTGWLYKNTDYCYPYQLAPCDHHTTGQYGPCPKTTHTPDCMQKCVPEYNKSYKSDRHTAKDVYRVPSKVPKMQTQIMENGPIQVQFMVHEDFLTYKSGVYQHTHGKKIGLHAVKMVGWGMEGKTAYWLIANSWNTDWGDRGFFKIRRGVDECGIEDQGVAGIPNL